MDKSLQRLCAAGLVALVMSGCASQRSPMEGIRGQQAPAELLNQAEQQSGSQAAQSRLQAADILARRGDTAQALQVAANIDAAALPDAPRARWALLLSQLGLEQQDGRSVLKATELLDENVALSRDAELTLRQRRGLALGMVGDPQAAASTLIALQAEQPPFDLNDAIWRQLTRLRGSGLEAIAQQSPLARGWVELLGLQRRYGSDIARLFALLDDWRARNPNHPAARRLPSDLQALRELRGQDVRRIAVFLPESGPLENVAAALRKGIETRLMNALNQGEQTPQLTFYDTSSATIETLYAQATLAGAQVVLGPLSKDTVTQLEQRPSVPLPTLALNYGTSPENRADDLFQYGLSAEDEARQAARRATLDGYRRAGLLVPDNAWGQRVADSFRQAWQAEGGTVAAQLNYNPEGSVANAVRPLANRQLDMLFLLALPPFARQVPPTLDYFDAGELPIYATSQLYGGEPQPRLDHDLNGVQFVEIPWLIPDAAVGGAEALPYYDSYQALYESSDPALLKLQAMGVDAFELARRLPLLKAAPDFEYFGATGALHAGEDRRLKRVLPWAQFRAGVPQPLLRGIQQTMLAPTEPAGEASQTAGGDAHPTP